MTVTQMAPTTIWKVKDQVTLGMTTETSASIRHTQTNVCFFPADPLDQARDQSCPCVPKTNITLTSLTHAATESNLRIYHRQSPFKGRWRGEKRKVR